MQLMQSKALRDAKDRLSQTLLGGESAAQTDTPPDVLYLRDEARERGRAETRAGIPGIHGVGLGRENPKDPDSAPRFRIYVSPEFAESIHMREIQSLGEINGVPIEVLVSQPAFLHQLPQCSNARRQKQRPVVGGISTGHFNITAGTIGCFCRSSLEDEEEMFLLLSNNHVLANVNSAVIGDSILQPGPADGGSRANVIGELYRYEQIQLGRNANNLVDAAVARVSDPANVRNEICSIGPVTGAQNGVEGQEVRMHGRTTALNYGRITDEAADVLISMDPSDPSVVARFVDQFRVEPIEGNATFGQGGDSGSLLVDAQDPTAVGLYFAGPNDGSYGLANPVENVIKALDIEIW